MRAPGCSQLKHKKSGVGSYTEEVLEWFECPHASGHLGCKVSCQGVPNRPASPLLSQGQPNGGETCIVNDVRWTRGGRRGRGPHSNNVLDFIIKRSVARQDPRRSYKIVYYAGCKPKNKNGSEASNQLFSHPW